MRYIYKFQVWLIKVLWGKLPIRIKILTFLPNGARIAKYKWIRSDTSWGNVTHGAFIHTVNDLLFQYRYGIIIPVIAYKNSLAFPLRF